MSYGGIKWGWEREARINWSMVTCQGSTRFGTTLMFTGSVPADSRQLKPSVRKYMDPINSGLTRCRIMAVKKKENGRRRGTREESRK